MSDDLDGTRWALEYVNLEGVSHLVSGRRIPEIAFDDGRIAADDGVNRGNGPYTVRGDRFLGGPFTLTRMAYPEQRLPEHDLFDHLSSATTLTRHGDFLHVCFPGGELVYRWEDAVVEPA